ncbi:MAG: SIMPL domain-containing protein [Gemmatimonadaceae bacterium]|nr:SIMPL domain-containing protein [Gemmatimonadaceae bacterium]
MHCFIRLGIAATLAASRTGIAQVPPSPIGPEVSVVGRGEVNITPDRAVLIVTVESRALLAARAAADNARKVDATITALHAAGVKPAELTNGSYSVAQDYEASNNSRRPNGFMARNTLRIEVPLIADVGRLIDAALSGGATQVLPVQFLGPDIEGARRRALAIAVREARLDAEALAAAAGGSLGKLMALSTSMSPGYMREAYIVATSSLSSSYGPVPTNLTPADLTITAVASARWEFIARRAP